LNSPLHILIPLTSFTYTGISVTTPRFLSQEDSDGVDEEVEESISSRLVEVGDEPVDEMIEEESPSENYSSEYLANGYEREEANKVNEELVEEKIPAAPIMSTSQPPYVQQIEKEDQAKDEDDDPYGEDDFEVCFKQCFNVLYRY